MRSVLRRVCLGLAAGLVLMAIPADAQLRPNSRNAKTFNPHTRKVRINVSPSDYDLASMTATITVLRAIRGTIRTHRPWTLTVRADPFFELKRHGISRKPCSDLAIRDGAIAVEYHVLSSTRAVVARGPTPENGRSEDLEFDLVFAAKPDDVAGEYSIELYFEFSEN